MIKWIAGALVLGSGYLLVRSSQLKNLAKEFIIRTNVRIHKFTGISITFAVDVLFLNPTDASLTIEHPFVAIYADQASLKANDPLLTSQLIKNSYHIKPNFETAFQPIYITLDFTSALIGSTLWKIAKKFLAKETGTMYVRTTAKIAGIKTIEQVKTFTYGG